MAGISVLIGVVLINLRKPKSFGPLSDDISVAIEFLVEMGVISLS